MGQKLHKLMCFLGAAFTFSTVLAATEACDPDSTLSLYYAQEACSQGDFPACDELHRAFSTNMSERLAARTTLKNSLAHRSSGVKPEWQPPFAPGDLVKYKGPDGRQTVAEIQGSFKASPKSEIRLIGTNPTRGTIEVREDPVNIKKIDRAEFDKIAADNILAAVGFASGANVICEIGGQAVNVVLEEVSGSVFDEAKQNIWVKTANGLKKIPIDSIKKAALKPLQGANVARVLRVMSKFVKLGSLLHTLGGGVFGAALVEVMAPTDVACAEIIALLYTDLKPNCSTSRTTNISEYFRTLSMDEQKKLVRGSTHICDGLKKYISTHIPQGANKDYDYSHLECSQNSVSFRSNSSLFPQLLLPGNSEGYTYEMRSTEGSKNVQLIAMPYSSCRNADMCANPPSKDAVRIFMTGSEVSTMSLNGTLVSAQSNSSLYKPMLEQAYNFHRQLQSLRNECIRMKNGEAAQGTSTQ